MRQAWDLAPGPVPSLITAIEDAGGFILRRHLAGRELDAVSQRMAEGNPLFLLNFGTPADRERLRAPADEVGHLVMHRVPSEDQERQADQFRRASSSCPHATYFDHSRAASTSVG